MISTLPVRNTNQKVKSHETGNVLGNQRFHDFLHFRRHWNMRNCLENRWARGRDREIRAEESTLNCLVEKRT